MKIFTPEKMLYLASRNEERGVQLAKREPKGTTFRGYLTQLVGKGLLEKGRTDPEGNEYFHITDRGHLRLLLNQSVYTGRTQDEADAIAQKITLLVDKVVSAKQKAQIHDILSLFQGPKTAHIEKQDDPEHGRKLAMKLDLIKCVHGTEFHITNEGKAFLPFITPENPVLADVRTLEQNDPVVENELTRDGYPSRAR